MELELDPQTSQPHFGMAMGRGFVCLALVAVSVCYGDMKDGELAPLQMPAALTWDKNQSMLLGGVEESSLYQQMIFGSMRKRQSCRSGYAQCLSHPSLCCPDTPGAGCCQDNAVCVSAGQSCCSAAASINACDVGEKCCQYGCAPEGSECCSDANRYCDPGYQCCDNGGCAPEGAQCCRRGTDGRPAFCEAGNRCYTSDETYNGIQCCTSSQCTAYVKGGTTISATTRALPEPTTRIVDTTVYYTFSWTFSYYYYFYTVYLQQSTVDSTLRYTTTTFSVQATDSSDASSRATAYAAEISPTPPPEASTQLRTASPETSPTSSAETAAYTGGGSGGGEAGTNTVTATVTSNGEDSTVTLSPTLSPTQQVSGSGKTSVLHLGAMLLMMTIGMVL